MNPKKTPDDTGTQMQAALALGREARRRGQEAIFPDATMAEQDSRHLLIEGTLDGVFLKVAMPNGETWSYRHPLPDADGRVLLAHIDTAEPQVARIFRPTAEGVHPYLCEATRFGVERRAA